MGSAHPGPWHTGSVTDLYARLFDVAKVFVPPLCVLNDKLRSGIDHAGEHGIHIRWQPLELNSEEYELFCRDLLNPERTDRFTHVESPESLGAWNDWSWWIYKTHLEPTMSRAGGPGLEQIDLMRQYRLALLHGDRSRAEKLAARIREEYDPDFA